MDLTNVKEIINNIENEYKNRAKSEEEIKMLEEIEDLKEEIKKLYQEGSRKDLFLSKVGHFQ